LSNSVPLASSCRAHRLVGWLTRPAVVVIAILALHGAARVAALCGPGEVDSFLYSVAAYKFWHADATLDDLVSDKPPGQAMLTGWCYHLTSGPPSRLVLAPIESAFLLGAYATFWLLARRLFGGRVAPLLTFLFALGYNSYGMDHGFNLNESYIALPLLVAVLAHLTIGSPVRRGLLRGLGLGLALAIKQTAVGVVVVCVVHGVVSWLMTGRDKRSFTALGMTVAGVALVWLPVGVVLLVRGWLGGHLGDLTSMSGRHLGVPWLLLPGWDTWLPVLPLVWWMLLGVVAGLMLWNRSGRQPGGAIPEQRDHRVQMWPVLLFAGGWLAVEAAIVWSLVGTWLHYYQQIVAPMVLLAGIGAVGFSDRIQTVGGADRLVAWRWAAVVTCVLTVVAAMPVAADSASRMHRLDREREVERFAWWLEHWTCHSIGGAVREAWRETAD